MRNIQGFSLWMDSPDLVVTEKTKAVYFAQSLR